MCMFGEFIAKQPNGLICKFSGKLDCVTNYNMTEEDYIEMRAEEARKLAKEEIDCFLEPYERVEKEFRDTHMSREEFREILKKMKETVADTSSSIIKK